MSDAEQLSCLREWLTDLADEMGEDSSGDWGEKRDPVGVGWEKACRHFAGRIRDHLNETAGSDR